MAIGKFFAALTFGALVTTFATTQAAPPNEDLAKNLTQQLAARQFDAVVGQFDQTMSSAMPSAKLGQTWDAVTGQAGAFQSIAGTTLQAVQGYQVVLVTTHFEKATLALKWVFDDKNRVAGLFVVPAEAPAAWAVPDYAQPDKFHEMPVTIGTSPWQLDGTLTLPNGAGPFPAVVLVGGSGPEDQDETIVGNKPFKDLAWGLASRGTAVLRFNKRTFQYGKELNAHQAGFTVNEESVDDARAAVALLAARTDINPKRIFVLGHSLGGMLAPRIAQGDPQVAGLIIMAGPTRPFEQVLVAQIRYIASLQGPLTPEAQKQIDSVEKVAQQIESPSLTADTYIDVLGSSIPGSYFLDLRSYHPAEVAAGLKIPMLILHGARDYQVTAEDTAGWQKALAGKPRVTFIDFPTLYHLFMPSSTPGTGLGTPSDYQKADHVAPQVINDIAIWVQFAFSKSVVVVKSGPGR
jgi:hypothetical protein